MLIAFAVDKPLVEAKDNSRLDEAGWLRSHRTLIALITCPLRAY